MSSPLETALKIKEFLQELCVDLWPQFVVIGGWAVHAYGAKAYSLAGDAMLSYEAQGTVRDRYEVTKNAKMRKEQFIGPTGHEVILHVEHQHGLRIPFEKVQAYAKERDGLLVPCVEHLLTLKLADAHDRLGTAQGRKDAEDLLGLLLIARHEFQNPSEFVFLEEPDWELMQQMANDIGATEAMAGGNAWEARGLREDLGKILSRLKAEVESHGNQPRL